MAAAYIITGLKANAVVARSTVRTAAELAEIGDGPAVRALVAARLDESMEALAQLRSAHARSVIGARVDLANDAHRAIASLSTSVHAGTMPDAHAFAQAIHGADTIASHVLAVA